MVRTVIEMWRAIKGEQRQIMENIIGVIPHFIISLHAADHKQSDAFDDDERMSLVCIKLEKLVDKNLGF